MHVYTEFDKSPGVICFPRWQQLRHRWQPAISLPLKVPKDLSENERRSGRMDRGRFDRSKHRSPLGLVFIPPLRAPTPPPSNRPEGGSLCSFSVPACRTCVRIRFHAIPFDRVPRINYSQERSTFSLLVSPAAKRVTRTKKRRQLIARRGMRSFKLRRALDRFKTATSTLSFLFFCFFLFFSTSLPLDLVERVSRRIGTRFRSTKNTFLLGKGGGGGVSALREDRFSNVNRLLVSNSKLKLYCPNEESEDRERERERDVRGTKEKIRGAETTRRRNFLPPCLQLRERK